METLRLLTERCSCVECGAEFAPWEGHICEGKKISASECKRQRTRGAINRHDYDTTPRHQMQEAVIRAGLEEMKYALD